MGSTGCKPAKSSSIDEEAESVSIGKGIRVHQLEGNNFLGRLQDATRLSYQGQRLWRRRSSNQSAPSSATTGASSSHRSSCYSELSTSVWQQQQQQQQQPPQTPTNSSNRLWLRQHFLSTAPKSSGASAGPPSSRSLDCGGPVDRNSGGSSSPDPDADADTADDASQMDLTTLLIQGFDPAAYEQRMAERRLAKFSVRRQHRSILTSTTATQKNKVAEYDAAAAEEAEIPS